MARFKLDYRRIFTLATLTLLLLSVFAPIGRIWVSADESWADPDCRYRMKLTFGNSASKENFTDFPVLVVLNSSRIDYSKTGATDIRFYDGSTLLSKETELWNASGNSYIWVKVPQIDNSNTDYIYAYYNCSGSSNLDDAASVWSSYAMVQHLEETSGTLTDSTPNHNDGTPSGVTLDTPGKIDGGDDYDGSSSYSVVNDSASLNFGTDSFSYMFWFKSRATGTQDILDKKGAAQGATNAGYKMTISSTNATGLSAALGDGTNNTRLDTGYDTSRGGNVWAMYAIVVDRIQQKMFAYINGTQRVNASISSIGSVSNTKQMYLGKEATGIAGRNYNGGLDEVRVLRMLPSADWVKAQYLSMSDQYVIYGGEESLYHPPDKPFNPNPANSATDVPISTTLSVNVTHPDGTRMDVYFYQPSVTSPPPENFTMVALPDTQIYSESYPSIFDNQTQWIADSTGNIRTVFVTHEGDVINVNSATVQWQNANHSMSKLDGHVPWGIAPGNHELDSNTTNYNTYFGYDRFVGESWYGGAYNNVNTNSYELFTGGHDDYLIFHLQYGVNDSVLAWANTTLASYPNRRVIVTAHDYMNSAGTRSTTGTLIWNDFIAPHAEQVFLVLCGHSPGEASRTDVVNGHTIYQLSADFQDRPNGGNGWLRTLEFRPTEDKIYVKTYSPYLNSYENDANSEFTLDYNMTHYTYLPPVLIGVATNVPSGGVASVTWKVLNFSTTYRWYAVAVDTLGASNQSETWNFTTSAAGCVVYIDPALVEKNLSNVGSTFDVELSIQNVVGLFGFDFNLTWNKAFITLVNAEYSSELNNVWGPGNWVVVKDEIAPGAYKLVATSTSTDFSGNHPLVKLTFRVEYCAGQRETPIHFEVHKLSDSHWTPISHAAEDGTYRIAGGRPRLDMNPATKTCRKYSETLTVKINVTNPGDAEDFRFEIHYNATLLDIAGISWTAWGSGTYNVDEINGNLTGYTSGSAISANTTLVTVIFNATYYHMWKDLPDWTNDVSSAIYLQWANLSYASASDLHYERGGLNDIDVGPDFTYTLSPIQGDIDNNGVVDIFDLRTIAAFYGTTDAQHNLTGEDIVDVYDIVVVASNFNYKYVP